MDILSRDYKPEYERLKKERLAEVAAEQQKRLDRLKKDVAQGGDSSIPINTGCMYTYILPFSFDTEVFLQQEIASGYYLG